MDSFIKVLLGIVIGVFIASSSPETAQHIRDYTLDIAEYVKGAVR